MLTLLFTGRSQNIAENSAGISNKKENIPPTDNQTHDDYITHFATQNRGQRQTIGQREGGEPFNNKALFNNYSTRWEEEEEKNGYRLQCWHCFINRISTIKYDTRYTFFRHSVGIYKPEIQYEKQCLDVCLNSSETVQCCLFGQAAGRYLIIKKKLKIKEKKKMVPETERHAQKMIWPARLAWRNTCIIYISIRSVRSFTGRPASFIKIAD